jgi:hypothetical protein
LFIKTKEGSTTHFYFYDVNSKRVANLNVPFYKERNKYKCVGFIQKSQNSLLFICDYCPNRYSILQFGAFE